MSTEKGQGHQGGFNPYRDAHGRWANGPATGEPVGPDLGTETQVYLVKGKTTSYQVWHRGEMVHEVPASRSWRADLAAAVEVAKTHANTTPSGAAALLNERIRQKAAASRTPQTTISTRQQVTLIDLMTEDALARNPTRSLHEAQAAARTAVNQLATDPRAFRAALADYTARQNERHTDDEDIARQSERYT